MCCNKIIYILRPVLICSEIRFCIVIEHLTKSILKNFLKTLLKFSFSRKKQQQVLKLPRNVSALVKFLVTLLVNPLPLPIVVACSGSGTEVKLYHFVRHEQSTVTSYCALDLAA